MSPPRPTLATSWCCSAGAATRAPTGRSTSSAPRCTPPGPLAPPSRLAADRRRGRVRGPVRGGADLYQLPASQNRPQLPAGIGVLPLCLLPPLAALLRLPRSRRRAVQRSADVLEGDRHLRGHRV